MANLGGALGVDPDGPTLHDVLAGRADVAAAIHAPDGEEGAEGAGNGPAVLPGETDLRAYADVDPSALDAVVDDLRGVDVVILDVGAGLSHDAARPLGLADATLLVTTTEPAALRDAAKTGELVETVGGTVAGAAVTRIERGDGPGPVADAVGAPVLGRIPEDDAVPAALSAGSSLLGLPSDAPAVVAYRRLASDLAAATGLDARIDATTGADPDTEPASGAEPESESDQEPEPEPEPDPIPDAESGDGSADSEDGVVTGNADADGADGSEDAGDADGSEDDDADGSANAGGADGGADEGDDANANANADEDENGDEDGTSKGLLGRLLG
jgi:septum site-determining protein MinD